MGERFELGTLKFNRNSKTDWQNIKDLAIQGKLQDIDPDVYVRYFHQLNSIAAHHIQPVACERTCFVFWGATGTGKSRRAWDEATFEAYSKDPRTKFWCGYKGQDTVVIDEFRGGIDIAHLLRWLDRYPVRIEVKGGSRPLTATKFWITSNLHPEHWYPDCDRETMSALMRRLLITEFT